MLFRSVDALLQTLPELTVDDQQAKRLEMGTGGRQLAAMLACEARIADHRKIMGIQKVGQGFSAQQAYELHLEERAWLESKLNEPFDGKTVVITHHAPSRGSVHPRFRGDPCNSAFVSDLDELVQKADFWLQRSCRHREHWHYYYRHLERHRHRRYLRRHQPNHLS